MNIFLFFACFVLLGKSEHQVGYNLFDALMATAGHQFVGECVDGNMKDDRAIDCDTQVKRLKKCRLPSEQDRCRKTCCEEILGGRLWCDHGACTHTDGNKADYVDVIYDGLCVNSNGVEEGRNDAEYGVTKGDCFNKCRNNNQHKGCMSYRNNMCVTYTSRNIAGGKGDANYKCFVPRSQQHKIRGRETSDVIEMGSNYGVLTPYWKNYFSLVDDCTDSKSGDKCFISSWDAIAFGTCDSSNKCVTTTPLTGVPTTPGTGANTKAKVCKALESGPNGYWVSRSSKETFLAGRMTKEKCQERCEQRGEQGVCAYKQSYQECYFSKNGKRQDYRSRYRRPDRNHLASDCTTNSDKASKIKSLKAVNLALREALERSLN